MNQQNKKMCMRAIITGVIDEGVKSALHHRALTEKEKQVSMTPKKDAADDLFGGGDGDSDEESVKSSKTMDDESEKLKQGDIKPKDIVEKLNAIRSGRSFRDSAVSGAMEDYIDSLSKAEKVALMAFLKGISQIVTGEVSANDASEPGDDPADVEMDRSNEKDVIHKTPNVIKGSPAAAPAKKKSQGAEDTSAPAPITPKRR